MGLIKSSIQQEPELTLIFDKGKVLKETSGFEGKSCTETTAFVEEILNAKNQKVTFKPEYSRNTKKFEGPLRA